MLVREQITDAKTGETIERLVEVPGVFSHEQAIAADLDRLSSDMRHERDRRIAATDWTMLPDAPLTDQQLESYLQYRQALRDVASQAGFPTNIIWPSL